MTGPVRITRAAALPQIPAGARIPIGNPPQWIAAAIAADWQCQCLTAAKGRAKDGCGRSHWEDENHRCRHTAKGLCAVRLVLAPDATIALRLLCEPCTLTVRSTLAPGTTGTRPLCEPCAAKVRPILIPGAGRALRLLCEPCAAGHARTTARIQTLLPQVEPADQGQDALFAL